MELSRDQLLLKMGAAKALFPAAWRLVNIRCPRKPNRSTRRPLVSNYEPTSCAKCGDERGVTLTQQFEPEDPAKLWQFYIQLTQVEAPSKTSRMILSCGRFFTSWNIESSAYICGLLAYCLHVSLRARLRVLAPGLTPRSIIEKFAAIQMLDVHFPTNDGRELMFCRYTSPKKTTRCFWLNWGGICHRIPPRITQKGQLLKD